MILLSIILFLCVYIPGRESKDGLECGICELLIAEIENIGLLAPELILDAMGEVCNMLEPLSKDLSEMCTDIVVNYGEKMVDFIIAHADPGSICRTLHLCDQCFLYPNSANSYSDEQSKAELMGVLLGMFAYLLSDVDRSIILKPVDLDGDGFSSIKFPGTRGSNWKGRDCNDFSKNVHPMLKGVPGEDKDNNCNGIKGKDKLTGKTYEELYCDSFEDDMNFITFGDSVCAGFSIQDYWLDLKKINEFLDKVLTTLLCFPENSLLTGFDTMKSLYLEMSTRNRCMHRQWTNMCVSGAVMRDLVGQIQAFNVPREKMKKSLVYIGYIGNDICKNTLEEMTTPSRFKRELVAGLNLLDTKINNGSKVLLIGLSNGKQYDLMHNQSHPISSPKHPVTFAQFYDFLSCVGLNVCQNWLTSNAEQRAAATQRSLELDQVILEVHKEYKFNNFETQFVDIDEVINNGVLKMIEEGIPDYKFFNQVDGFHPSIEYGHPYAAMAFVEVMEERFPGWLGSVNENNEEIEKRFGDQGGY